MPVKIDAKLLHRSVFFTGETVHCQVAFTYVESTEQQIRRDDENSFEHGHINPNPANLIHEDVTIAWASAQIYCQCHVNESGVTSVNNLKGQNHFTGNVLTSFVPTSGR